MATFPEVPGYTTLKHLGSGSFGEVYEVEDEDGNKFALKVISKSQKPKVKREIKIMKKVREPDGECPMSIVCYYELFTDNHQLFLIMTFVEDGMELGDYFDEFYRDERTTKWNIPNDEIYGTCLLLAKGLEYLHSFDVAHRDIKMENIMVVPQRERKNGDIVPPRIVLIDFGFACETNMYKPKSSKLNKYRCTSAEGTPLYLPPEAADEENINDWKATDVWAMGAVFFRLCNNGDDHFEVKLTSMPQLLNILKDVYTSGSKNHISHSNLTGDYSGILNFVTDWMLSPSAELRPTMSYVVDALLVT